jgi:hypothetical protein
VAVVVPLHLRDHLTPDEEISVRHLNHFLGRYPRVLVSPESLDFSLPGFQVRRVGDEYFGSAAAHRRLLLSRMFYELFLDYEYILFYHLDALVFADRLEEWCEKGFDYVGPPWLVSEEDPNLGFSRAGNGGFSLRRVRSFLRVMDSKRLSQAPRDHWKARYAGRPLPVRILNAPKRVLKHLRTFNGVRWELDRFPKNEDRFWSDRAVHYDPDFRVAPVEEALRFAFEVAPRYCFERNGRRLPFGCHAWPVYDRTFWEPHLLRPEDVGELGAPDDAVRERR